MRKRTAEQEMMVATVRQFVDKEVIPVASEMEHRNEYPHALVEQMRKMGLFGLNVPEEYGGAEVDYTTLRDDLRGTFARLAGPGRRNRNAFGAVRCAAALRDRRTEARDFFRALASGERRGGICLSEANAGTDLQNISDHRDAIGRRLSHQRIQDVDH